MIRSFSLTSTRGTSSAFFRTDRRRNPPRGPRRPTPRPAAARARTRAPAGLRANWRASGRRRRDGITAAEVVSGHPRRRPASGTSLWWKTTRISWASGNSRTETPAGSQRRAAIASSFPRRKPRVLRIMISRPPGVLRVDHRPASAMATSTPVWRKPLNSRLCFTCPEESPRWRPLSRPSLRWRNRSG